MQIFQNGYSNGDFIVINPLNVQLTEEKSILLPIVLQNTEFWQKIKSMAWSSACNFFVAIDKNQMIIGRVDESKAFLSNLSIETMEVFLEGLQKNNKKK